MIEFILFAGACVLVALVVRAWRRRERAAFHQLESQVLSNLRQEAGVRDDEVSPMQISSGPVYPLGSPLGAPAGSPPPYAAEPDNQISRTRRFYTNPGRRCWMMSVVHS